MFCCGNMVTSRSSRADLSLRCPSMDSCYKPRVVLIPVVLTYGKECVPHNAACKRKDALASAHHIPSRGRMLPSDSATMSSTVTLP